MQIPNYMLPQQVTIEKYIGKSATGYVFSEPVEYKARVEPSKQRVTTPNGDLVQTAYRAFMNPKAANDDIPPLSRLTYNGTTFIVQTSMQQHGFTLSHLELRF